MGGILNAVHGLLNPTPGQQPLPIGSTPALATAANANDPSTDPNANAASYSAPTQYGAPIQSQPQMDPNAALSNAFARSRMASDPNWANTPEGQQYMALLKGASGVASGTSSNPAADSLQQYGQQVSQGALSNIDKLQLQRQQDAQAKQAAIQNAMNILKASQTGQINLPLLAFSAGVGQPTRTGGFTEALSNGMNAAVPVLENQRVRQAQLAEAQGNLGVQAADVPLTTDQQALQEWNDRLKTGEQAQSTAAIVGGRLQGQAIQAQERAGAAGLRAVTSVQDAQIAQGGKIDSAYINANKNAVEYLGQDSTDPTRGVYLNKNFGTTNYGPLIQNYKGTDPAAIKEADALMKSNPKMFPDLPTAFSYVKSGIQTPAEFGKEVGVEKALLVKAGYDPNDPTTENAARQQVIDRQTLLKQYQSGGGGAQAPATTQTPTAAPAAPAGSQGQQGAPAEPAMRKASPDEIQRAQDALSKGADRGAVIDRFRQNGVELPPSLAAAPLPPK